MNSKYLALLLVFAQTAIKADSGGSSRIKKVFPMKGKGELSISTNCAQAISVKEDTECSTCTIIVTKKGSPKHFDNLTTTFKQTKSKAAVEVKTTIKDVYATSTIEAVVPKGTLVKCTCKGKTLLTGAISEA